MGDLAGRPVDLGEWLQWYAFDVIGNITFSQTFGFLKDREDNRHVIDGLEASTRYSSVIGQIPELHPWLLGNERLVDLSMKIPAAAKSNPIFTLEKVCLEPGSSRVVSTKSRLQMTFDGMDSYNQSKSKKQRGDYLEFLRQVQEKDPNRLSDRDITTALFSNLWVFQLMQMSSINLWPDSQAVTRPQWRSEPSSTSS